MSRLYWSNLPDAKSPRGSTSTLCSSLTTEDLPMPEYPETSTSSAAVADYAIEAGEQGLYLARPSVQLLGKQQAIGRVVFAKRKGVDAPLTLPFGETVPKIALDASCRLVALLGGLRQQLHDDFGNRSGDIQTLTGRRRLSGNMAVHPLHGVGRGERQRAREHLVERDAERVEVAAGIDRTIHPSGLFGRHVGECTGDSLWRLGRLSLTRHA